MAPITPNPSTPTPYDLPPHIQRAYADYLRNRMEPRLGETPEHLRSRTTDDMKARGFGSVLVSAGLGYLSGGWAGAAIGAIGAFANQSPKRKQPQTDIQGITGFGDTGQAIAQPGSIIPVVHCNAVRNPNGGRRLAGVPIFTEIVTRRGRQERNVKYLVSIGRIGSIEEDETLIDEQPRTIYLGDELAFQYRNGADNQTPIYGMAYYSQVVKPRQFADVLLDKRGVVNQIEEVSQSGEGFVNALVTDPGTVCGDGQNLPSGVFGTQAIDPFQGGILAFETPNGAAGVGLSTQEVDQGANSADFGFVFDGVGEYSIVESGTVVAGPFPYSDVSQFTIIVTRGFLANPPNPAQPSQVIYQRSGQQVYTSFSSPTSELFLDIGFPNPEVCIGNVEINGNRVTPNTTSTFRMSLQDGDDFEAFYALEIYHICPDVFIKIIEKDEQNRALLFETAQHHNINGEPASVGLGDLEGRDIYRYEYIRYENTKRIGGRGETVAVNGRCARFNLSFNLHAFDDQNQPVLHGLVYDVWIRRVDQPQMSHLIRLYTEDQLRRETFGMFDVQNLPLGRYYWEIRPVICDCDGVFDYQLPDSTLGDKTCYQATGPGSPLVIEIIADNGEDPFSGTYAFDRYFLVIGDSSPAFPLGSLFQGEFTDIGTGTVEETDCGVVLEDAQCAMVDGRSRSVYRVVLPGPNTFTWLYTVPTPTPIAGDVDYTVFADNDISPTQNPCPDSCLSAFPIYELGDFGQTYTINVPYDAGDNNVQVVGEIIPQALDPAQLVNLIGFDVGKADVSSQQSRVARAEFICEQVTPDKHEGTSNPDAVAYPGMATPALTFRDVRTQGSMNFFISEGVEDWNHLEAGENPETQANPLQFVDPRANFLDAGLAPGMLIEDIITQQRATILAVNSATELQLDSAIDWTPCGFYRAGFVGAINYFPDVLVYFIMNRDIGVGSYFPLPEFFIDWGSIAAARNYDESQGYFYDRAVAEAIPFRQWAEDEARNSHLILNVCGGMFELIVDEPPNLPDDIAFVFNASNTDEFTIEAVRQQESIANTCIVTFPDGRRDQVGGFVVPNSFSHDGHSRGRPQSVIIETAARAAGLEPRAEVTYESDSITNEYQAVDVGALYLKRLRARRRAQIKAPWASLMVKAGDWVAASEKRFDGATVWSGYVREIVEPWDPGTGTQVIKISDCMVRYRACVSTSSPGVFTLEHMPDILEYLSPNDSIRDYSGGEYEIESIDTETGEIEFSPAGTWNNLAIEFLKGDFAGDEAIVFHYADGTADESTDLTGIIDDDGEVCIQLSTDTPIAILDPITIGPTILEQTLYRVTDTTPDKDDTVLIVATEASVDHYNRDDLVIKYDDAAIIV